MRTSRWTLTLPLAAAFACTDAIPTDNLGDPASRVVPTAGIIRGSILYQGPRPCSANGHIVGNVIVFAFDARTPPPPAGLGTTPVNFAAVEGDVLFADEPRWGGSTTYCPLEHGFTETITASTPFSLSPLGGAEYVLQSFYDYTGNFLPTFKFRQLPERGDVGGGVIDTAAALAAINQNPDYLADFLHVAVGIARPLEAGAPAGTVPIYDIPSDGFIADNVQISLGQVLTTTRPYFYAQGMDTSAPIVGPSASLSLTLAQSSDVQASAKNTTAITGSVDISNPNYAPVLTIPQDIHTFAPPQVPAIAGPSGANKFEGGGKDSMGNVISGLPHLRLVWGAGATQASVATAAPFNMQIAPFNATTPADGGGFSVWRSGWLNPMGQVGLTASKMPIMGPIWQGQYIPEGAPVPNFWPLVILSKLVDDPGHTKDPASLAAQGDATHPVVIMQGITVVGTPMASGNSDPDSIATMGAQVLLLSGAAGPAGAYFTSTNGSQGGQPIIGQQDHVTVALRPAVICFNTLFDPNNSNKHGNIVTPYLFSESTDVPPMANTPVVPVHLLDNNDPSRVQVTNLVEPPSGWKAGTPPALEGCLPTGRYAINVVYPDGQAWTVPNESGACTGTATGEGNTLWPDGGPGAQLTCSIQPRPVIQSQGPRAVVEVVASTTGYCKSHPVPAICQPTSSQ